VTTFYAGLPAQPIYQEGPGMPWARFDDQYHRNPKVLSVAASSRWLHAASVTHCRIGTLICRGLGVGPL